METELLDSAFADKIVTFTLSPYTPDELRAFIIEQLPGYKSTILRDCLESAKTGITEIRNHQR